MSEQTEQVKRLDIDEIRSCLSESSFKNMDTRDLEVVGGILIDPVWRAQEEMLEAVQDAGLLLDREPDSPNRPMAEAILKVWPVSSELFNDNLTNRFSGPFLSAALIVEEARKNQESKE